MKRILFFFWSYKGFLFLFIRWICCRLFVELHSLRAMCFIDCSLAASLALSLSPAPHLVFHWSYFFYRHFNGFFSLLQFSYFSALRLLVNVYKQRIKGHFGLRAVAELLWYHLHCYQPQLYQFVQLEFRSLKISKILFLHFGVSAL